MLTDYQKYRFYEFLPGLSIWLTLILGIVFSIFKPLWMIYFIIVFDVYWVLKVVNFVFYLLVAWRRFHKIRKINWKEALYHEIPDYDSKQHLVFLTVYNEEWGVVEDALKSLEMSIYDKNKFTIIIAGEARKEEHCKSIFVKVKENFGFAFDHILFTLHPVDLPDENPGKGSNLFYSEQIVKEYVDGKGWKYEDVIVTVFDIDTICHESYFAYLTYLYCISPDPTRTSFQPVALYNNNMWESPSVLRVMAFGTTFWMMTSLARQDALVTFSSHSMSFTALVKAGFHEKRIVSEDSRIFYQCLLAYEGNYNVTPMYIPVSMDTVRDDNWWKSITNLYKQQRRWAWGVEHVPYLIWEFKKHPNIPLWKKIKWVFVEWEGKWSWSLAAIIITILGRLPLWLADDSIRQSVIFLNAPHMLEKLMSLAMVGLFLSAFFSLPLLPKPKKVQPKYLYIIMLLQWALLPLSMIFVSAIPSIEAVTRLMFGKYLGFDVSQKKRK
ncbi:MAG: hypothetical protein COY69_03270 [Candidatus Magasanikbacteria bacterium CG_4_10_14_0_8_um_filter_32_14]|uniref:Glycosyltransferase 2-like domain-containing protein n=2 Tax=Candidatus Magasanikiibacteriota TaxID=1752731 RepID=A0A2M7R8N8_9BACT|nr:MAG: hypothetical protein AUJ23_00675 [Candidatus Magasanikbacteria bacterium CG1_02_32_51]PIY93129.1 MAG: hypothetical protein COY69_03270 [Candidatus Magasanikbacteria bacterium CG_4_10_14_0_8_um_filter_32_14]